MSVNEKMKAIADAIRGKTGGTDSLTLDQMAAAIAGIETGGGGSMESGELTTTSANYYRFTIPVSSKKTRILVCPKSIDDVFAVDQTDRSRIAIAIDGDLFAHGSLGKSDATRIVGSLYWNRNGSADAGGAVFNNDSIVITIAYSPWALGNYYWYAW